MWLAILSCLLLFVLATSKLNRAKRRGLSDKEQERPQVRIASATSRVLATPAVQASCLVHQRDPGEQRRLVGCIGVASARR